MKFKELKKFGEKVKKVGQKTIVLGGTSVLAMMPKEAEAQDTKPNTTGKIRITHIDGKEYTGKQMGDAIPMDPSKMPEKTPEGGEDPEGNLELNYSGKNIILPAEQIDNMDFLAMLNRHPIKVKKNETGSYTVTLPMLNNRKLILVNVSQQALDAFLAGENGTGIEQIMTQKGGDLTNTHQKIDTYDSDSFISKLAGGNQNLINKITQGVTKIKVFVYKSSQPIQKDPTASN